MKVLKAEQLQMHCASGDRPGLRPGDARGRRRPRIRRRLGCHFRARGDIDPSAPLAMPLMLPPTIALSISVLTIKPPDAMALAVPMERFETRVMTAVGRTMATAVASLQHQRTDCGQQVHQKKPTTE